MANKLESFYKKFENSVKDISNTNIQIYLDFDYVLHRVQVCIENLENKRSISYYITENDLNVINDEKDIDKLIYKICLSGSLYIFDKENNNAKNYNS